MPLTFIDIERRKSWRIALFFLVLMALYLVLTVVIAAAFHPFPLLRTGARFWIFAGAAALLVAGFHFWSSARGAVSRVVKSLDAQPPDPQDRIHKMLLNIADEIHVVTGNRRKMRCLVIPSLSLNALAAADLAGDAVIGVTEGLLSRLTRPQLEAVVAHEAHHILSGDCLETTIAAGIFGAYSAALENISRATRGRSFVVPAVLLAWVLLKLSTLLNLFISREREYRADAASVRMTRNPVALAETLHLLSRSWRGSGFIGRGFEMLCIVNPVATALDEAEGLLPDLLSTHPPLRRRIDVLLNMARLDVTALEAKTTRKKQPSAQPSPEPAYYAMTPQSEWQGPLSIADLAVLPWLSPLTWIAGGSDGAVDRAWKHPALNAIFAHRLAAGEPAPSGDQCPRCRQPLVVTGYEGTQIRQCRFCGGALVDNGKIPRILARTERPCTDRVAALSRAVERENQRAQARRRPATRVPPAAPLLGCPRCKNPMFRGFYSLVYLVEVDRCSSCGVTWFDRDELEMLQCMVENRITA